MNFIEGLPKSEEANTPYVVVDWFTKYARFIPMTSHYTTRSVAHAFFDQIFKLHGLPLSIVLEKYTSLFWQEPFAKLEAQINLLTAYHPQSDGHKERES